MREHFHCYFGCVASLSRHSFLSHSSVSPNRPTQTSLVTREEKTEGNSKYLAKPMFKHPSFSSAEMQAIHFEHRPTLTYGDLLTYNFMLLLRKSFDLFTGYLEPQSDEEAVLISQSKNAMTLEKWLARFIVLESVASIPGCMAGGVRHLHAIRLFEKDDGFIQTLYDEAYNERMHLLTFLEMAQPTRRTRIVMYGGQWAFAGCFTVVYLMSPKLCHRFVGYLEEEAVSTYSRCLNDMQLGICADLANEDVPQIAKIYWGLEDDCTMYDLLLYIRADEAKHREVNHTFANLAEKAERGAVVRNPFVLQIGDKPQPVEDLTHYKGTGWKLEEIPM